MLAQHKRRDSFSSEAFNEMSSVKKSQLIAGNPVTCASLLRQGNGIFPEENPHAQLLLVTSMILQESTNPEAVLIPI